MIEDAPWLDIDRIRAHISNLTVGSDLRYAAQVDSTNRVAAALKAGEWSNGTVVLTDFQEAGRGRRGRGWTAPPGSSLLCSIVLTVPPVALPTDMVMLAALAVTDALRTSTRLEVDIKWPNDLMIAHRKVSGILSETDRQGDLVRSILGIGINLNFDPSEVGIPGEAATSVRNELGHPVNREVVCVQLLKSLDLWYRYLNRSPDEVFAAYVGRLSIIDRPLWIADSTGTWQGTATGVQRDGGLLVRRNSGENEIVYAADVSVRLPGGFTSP